MFRQASGSAEHVQNYACAHSFGEHGCQHTCLGKNMRPCMCHHWSVYVIGPSLHPVCRELELEPHLGSLGVSAVPVVAHYFSPGSHSFNPSGSQHIPRCGSGNAEVCAPVCVPTWRTAKGAGTVQAHST